MPECVCGTHGVLAALERGPARVRRLFVAGGRRSGRIARAVRLAESREIPVETLPLPQLDEKAAGTRHQNLVAEVVPTPLLSLEELIEGQPEAARAPILLLDGMQDPRNFGAILRSAAALGAGGVVWPKDGAAGLTPVVAKAASGALETLPLARVTNLARAVSALKKAGYWALAADARGERALGEDELPRPCALVIGEEGRGVRRLVLEKCDMRVRIPIEAGAVSSINASVAAAILLYGLRGLTRPHDGSGIHSNQRPPTLERGK